MAVSSVAASDGAPSWVLRRRCLASGVRLLIMLIKAVLKASSSMAMEGGLGLRTEVGAWFSSRELMA